MRKFFTSYATCLASLLLAFGSTAAFAQPAKPLLTQPVVESQLVTLEGNTPPAALVAEYDRGAVDDTMQFDHMLLVLKQSPESEAALAKSIEAMHDSADTAAYHHWLSAQQIGERFGLATRDVEVIQAWLASHGFTVNRVYANGFVIDFSGSAAAVREAFHTEIHHLVLPNGEHHIANIRDPQ